MKNFLENVISDEERTELVIRLERQQRRESFYTFCQILAPDFYLDHRPHLKELCDTLQDFYAGKIINPKTGLPYKKLIIEMPPRHGKTRTLVLFCAWLLGQNNKTKIITGAYNDDLAFDFSKYTRNTIQEEKNTQEQIVYSDIFPTTRIKRGDSALNKWACDGNYFNFKSTGKGSGVTGKGCDWQIIDDLVKSAEDAFNDTQLAKDWQWFTGTWISRKEEGAKQIICGTPWSKNDVPGKILSSTMADEWYVFRRPAYTDGVMLCPDLLSYDSYMDLKHMMSDGNETIFYANYDLERVDAKGVLYGTNWKTYSELPKDDKGRDLTQSEIMWCDTADTGSDYLCAVFGRIYDRYCYVTDVYYTKEPVDITEPEIAKRLYQRAVSIGVFEYNGGGHAISSHIRSLMKSNHGWTRTRIVGFTQTKNKIARIMSESGNVKDRIIMPIDWAQRWPVFYKAVTTFLKEGKNKNDDAPDTLTQVIEYMDGKNKIEVPDWSAGDLGL